MKKRDGSLEKSARLVILLELGKKGKLKGMTLQEIADIFPDVESRSTIMRDLRDVERLREVLDELRLKMKQPTKRAKGTKKAQKSSGDT